MKGEYIVEQIIEVTNIVKRFKDKKALDGLNFTVDKGEIFGFLGPSGAGKTTTIKILTSQLLPSSGEAKIFNMNTYSLNKNIYNRIGVLTDTSGMYERLTIWENLQLYAGIYNLKDEAIDEVLESVGLINEKKTTVKKLSRGMKQRLLLARATINKPELLFLDEPTSSLDPGNASEVHKNLKKLNSEGTTIFLTTHNMEEADKLCDRVAFLNDGKIAEIGNPQNLKYKYAENKISIKLRGEDEKIVVSNDEIGAQRIKELMSDGKVQSIHSKEPSLEEIFLHVTGREL